MIRFMVHTPVNMRGRMTDYIKENLPTLEGKIGDKLTLYTPHDPAYTTDCSEEWLAPAIKKGIMPDVIVTHATEFAALDNRLEIDLFSDMAGRYLESNPVREELNMLVDPQKIFYPISVTPLVMVYNTERISQDILEHSWADLFNEKFKVIFPDRDKPLSRAVGAFLKLNYPEQFPIFEKRVVYDGSPNSVIKAVASGEYDMAITNSSFAEMAQGKRVVINSAKEGYILLPQVMVWKKDADEKLMALADILTGKEMQNYLAEQGAWAVLAGIPMCDTFCFNQQLTNWKGWDVYLKSVSEFDKFSV